MKIIVKKLKSDIVASGLSVRSDKFAVFYERRSGNRWYKGESESLLEIEFNNVKVPVLKCKETFAKPLTVAGETEEELIEMLNDYQDLLSLISESVALIAIKMEALETIALSNISHRFPNMYMTETELYEFDQLLVSAIRKIFNLTHSTATKTCFQADVQGGLGIQNPSIVYRATRISLW